jgi:integrase
MASIIKDKNREGGYNGCRTLQFVDANRQRKSVRLGKITVKGADAIKAKVEAILEATFAGLSWDNETSAWVGKMATTNAKLYDKLAAVGLLQKRKPTDSTTLGAFLDEFIASQRLKVKRSTATVYSHTQRCLVEYFGKGRLLAEIAPGHADEWRTWMGLGKEIELNGRKGQGLSDNTVRRRCGIARQFFRAAVRKRLIAENPFAEMEEGVSVKANKSRDYFITREEADKILEHCPDIDWKLIFALSRYGGLRCPSEHSALTWGDVNWGQERITVRSPKTAHHEGHESRVVPLFPELREHLQAALDDLLFDFDPKAKRLSEQPVIRRYRGENVNLRTQLLRIIQRAGLTPWPKLFQNLRATRATELVHDFPSHVAAAWLGHSEIIAQKHYRQVTDADYERALQMCKKTAEDSTGNEGKKPAGETSNTAENAELVSLSVGDTRLELVTSTV